MPNAGWYHIRLSEFKVFVPDTLRTTSLGESSRFRRDKGPTATFANRRADQTSHMAGCVDLR